MTKPRKRPRDFSQAAKLVKLQKTVLAISASDCAKIRRMVQS
jgi:hypothetical protein